MKKLRQILLAEDDPNDVELTIAALAEHKLSNRVDVVSDGVEALDYLYRRGQFSERDKTDPLVVLLDLKMPRLDGIQVLNTIKSDELLKTIPVVVLTSSKESKDLQKCYEMGVNAYVVKPVQFNDFVNAVKQIGVFWALINELPEEKS